MESNKSEITFLLMPDQLVVRASHTETVLEACLRAGIELSHSCGGMGTCGTCCVHVQGINLTQFPRNEIEQEMAKDRSFSDSERLACQIHPRAELKIYPRPEKID
jgi:ferredoxin